MRHRHGTTSGGEASANQAASAGEAKLLTKRDWSKWNRRFWTTWAMIGGLLVLVAMGHFAVAALVFVCQVMIFTEIVTLGHVLSKEQQLPGFRFLYWYWFVAALFFMYGRQLLEVFPDDFVDSLGMGFAVRRHSFFSFVVYILGVVGFVLSLKKGHYKYQFTMFAWVHLTVFLVVIQSSFLMYNLFEGMIWLVFPALLIVTNDVMAYFFGFFWGKTPLIKLSPKKTWEGFIGASFCTLIGGFVYPLVMARFQLLVCPKHDLTWAHPTCDVEYVFKPEPYELPSDVVSVLSMVGMSSWGTVNIMPIQWHGVIIAIFSSVIAPFGGFFASGFKRGFQIKDFGNVIPGHGGVTDRMDCQILNGMFVYVYYQTFIATVTEVSNVVTSFARLSLADQWVAMEQMQDILKSNTNQ